MLANQSVIFSMSSNGRHAPVVSVRQFEVSFSKYPLKRLDAQTVFPAFLAICDHGTQSNNPQKQIIQQGKQSSTVQKLGLLELDATASSFNIGFDLVALFFGSSFLKSCWAAFDHLLGFHQRSARDGLNDLNHVQLLIAEAS